jgi:hypothetical protein
MRAAGIQAGDEILIQVISLDGETGTYSLPGKW